MTVYMRGDIQIVGGVRYDGIYEIYTNIFI